ncbi:MAG: chromosome partitioning protein ParB [Gammaproteobacteria bacterium CG_4_10_14_0_8_um_filter_38_16]|nr:MAG: chromosome partitioning protein ParB [Gammaproteobacteria bacterium CG_4_10_14_0_8_um_filter_38_16]PJA03554.1 MAG: chromosome partitioning protein ParB [Gammaproteobacteria bacterium CG_4_10_14_0_2_um_filter_38_22]PJB11001.1 MAG: chromosome partitioning protein ParB [Gammaproteobacteria bacterium CG_4_9_14_3_um_filter_38_9]
MSITAVLKDLPVEFLSRGYYQPRRAFNEDALRELAESIASQGVIEPIIVREIALNRYEIIAGERRWRASQLAGLATVPCVIRHYTDAQAAEVTLIENIQREDLNPIEEALALSRLIDEFHYTHENLAKALGQSRAKITNTLRLLQLDSRVQQCLIDKTLSEGHGKILAGLPAAQQFVFAKRVIAESWSVRQLENNIQKEKNRSASVDPIDANIRRLEKMTSDHFGAEVILENNTNRSGWVKLKYQNYEVLAGILEKMGIKCE